MAIVKAKRNAMSMMAKWMEAACEGMRAYCARVHAGLVCGMSARLRDAKGQGTTEYAILVGVLVVIAMLAITVFKPKVQSLWDAISNGINGL